MIVKALWLSSLLILTLVVGQAPALAQARAPIDLPVEMHVPIAPTPFKADGKTHLVYELHLTNFSSNDLTLARVEVLAVGGATPLAQYEGTELTARLARPGSPQTNQEEQRVGGGMRAIVYIWLTVDAPTGVPVILRHRVTASLGAPAGSPGSDATKNEPIEVKGEGAKSKLPAGHPW